MKDHKIMVNTKSKMLFTEKSIFRKKPPEGVERQKDGSFVLWDTGQRGLGLRISAKGKRTYFMIVRPKGKTQEKVKLGTTDTLELVEARDMAREILKDAEKGIGKKKRKELEELKEVEVQRAQNNSFRAIAEQYLITPAGKGTSQGGAMGLRSKDEIEKQLERDIFPVLGSKPLHEITRDDIEELIAEIADEKPITANRTLGVLRRVFRWATLTAKRRREYGLDLSPTTGVEAPASENKRDRVLSESELARLWRASDKLSPTAGPWFKIMVLTAQRRAEVSGLRRDEIEEHRKHGQIWNLPGTRTKNRLDHIVQLAPLAKEIIDDVPKFLDGDGNVNQYVFSNGQRGDVPISGFAKAKERLDKIVIEDAAKAAGESPDPEKHGIKDWRFHDIRRTAATMMNEHGIEPHVVEAVLNHISGSAKVGVAGTYNRAQYLPARRRALEFWAKHILTITGGASDTDSNVTDLDERRA